MKNNPFLTVITCALIVAALVYGMRWMHEDVQRRNDEAQAGFQHVHDCAKALARRDDKELLYFKIHHKEVIEGAPELYREWKAEADEVCSK